MHLFLIFESYNVEFKTINFRGEVKSYHEMDLQWDLNDYVMQFRENKMQWKEIFWKMWAKTKVFK